MISLLAKWLIPNRDNTADGAVRRAYGQLCGFVGIGLNVLQKTEDFPEELRDKAGSLAMFAVSLPDRAVILAKLLKGIEAALDTATEDFEMLLQQYRTLCITLGREIQASGGADVCGLAEDINPDGELIVRDAQGELHVLRTADVSVRGVMGYV